ncbi:sulfurtransferase TusA family protein [Paenibacillus sp. IITD108]|uniref:sulfurtransferase TusA family protein n=1 Tax=Paenibacillus sp. IITD108 TaxID=3116649 RepID=UPI002F42756A
MLKADYQVDAKGMACPMPIVKTKKAMGSLEEGQVLEVQATDKGSKADLAAWAASVGYQYIGTFEKGEVLLHYIRKCSSDNVFEAAHEQTASNEEAATAAKQGGLLIDVREAAEYAFGHIEGAISIPLGELDERMNELDREKNIYLICRTGKRSDLAAQKVAKAGYSNVYNVLPGMTGWNGQLNQIVKAER